MPKDTGTIDGEGDYGSMMSAIDGDYDGSDGTNQI